MLQTLEALCRPVTLPSWGHRWGAAGPCPRAGRQTGVITWWATRSGGLAPWGGGDRRQERAAVLQPLEAPRWPAAPASPWWCEIRSGGRAAGPWPSPRAGRQTGPSPGGLPSPGAWLPGAGDRKQERAAVLQPLEAPRWPAAPASPWWCEIRSGGRAAEPWPSPRAGRQTGPSPGGLPGQAAWLPGAGDRWQERSAVLQPLAVQCRPATLPSWGHRWGAAGPWPCPRAGRQTGPSPGGLPRPAAWP